MDLPAFLAAGPGFLLGMMVLSPVLRWGLAIWVVAKERQRDPVHRSRWRIVATVLLHSGPWFAVATGTFTWFILSRPHAEGWDWGFGGALLSPLIYVFYARKLLKLQRARLKLGGR